MAAEDSDELSQLDAVDLAVAAYRAEGRWRVEEIAVDHLVDLDAVLEALRRVGGEHGAVGLITVDEDFFVLLRIEEDGEASEARLLLSDSTAAEEWELADEVLDYLGLPEIEEDDEPAPVGDLALLADLGVPAAELGDLIADLLEDDDLLPEETLSDVARLAGFGDLFDDVAGLTPA